MLCKITRENKFQIQKEESLNPYMGISSFQHFRGEALYSDVIMRPERKSIETENLECYPVPDYVPQNGRNEGYYPDGTVAYIRILWRDFEPRQGEYCYEFVEDILKKARSHGQTVMLRLMEHSTRACDDVPDWLKEIMPCPLRPDGMRVKDSPTDPRFVEYFGQAIRKLGERFDSDPTLDIVDISLTGSWGEGHNYKNYPMEDILKLVDCHTEVFQNTKLLGQSLVPELIHYAAKSALVGWRADSLGEPERTNVLYQERLNRIGEDLWKTAPVAFESSAWLGEWKRRGYDVDAVIERSLDWHMTYFNPKSVPIPYEWQDKIEDWIGKMGYHLALHGFSYPDMAKPGDELELQLEMENQGVAPMYNRIPVNIRLRGEGTCVVIPTEIDVRKWLPGTWREQVSVVLPKDLPVGTYLLEVGITSPDCPVIYLRTDAPRQDAYYTCGKIVVSEK